MFCDLVMFPFCVMTTTTTKIDFAVAGSTLRRTHPATPPPCDAPISLMQRGKCWSFSSRLF